MSALQQTLLAASSAAAVSGTAWDLTTASSGYTSFPSYWAFASGNRDVRNDADAPTNTGQGGFISTTSQSSGKWYFEFVATTSVSDMAVGVMDSGSSPPNDPALGTGRGDAWIRGNGQSFSDGTTTYNGAFGSWSDGDIIGVAADVGTDVRFYKNNTLLVTASLTTASIVAFMVERAANCRSVVNFLAADQTYSPPSGYSAWG